MSDQTVATKESGAIRQFLRHVVSSASCETGDAAAGPSVDTRLYRLLCLIAALVTLCIIAPINTLQGMSRPLILVVILLGLVCIGLYRLSLRGREYRTLFVTLIVLSLNAGWFFNAGSDSKVDCYYFAVTTLIFVFVKGWSRWVYLALFVLDAVMMLWASEAAPRLVVPYPNADIRMWNQTTTLVVTNLLCALMMAVIVGSYWREHNELRTANEELARRMEEIQTLRGLLPICAWCRKVRNDDGLWTQIEEYVMAHTGAAFSHGVCPECVEREFADIAEDVKSRHHHACEEHPLQAS